MKKEIDQNLSTNFYSPLSGESVPIRFDPEAIGFGKYKGIIKFIFINVINTILVIFIFLFISLVNKKANSIKVLRNEVLLNQEKTNIAVLKAELNSKSEEVEKIQNLFIDDDLILDLIKISDEMRLNGLITKFDILSQKPVRDGKLVGYPIEFEIEGNKELVNNSLKKIEELPFLYKMANIEIDSSDENNIKILIGIFIYAKN